MEIKLSKNELLDLVFRQVLKNARDEMTSTHDAKKQAEKAYSEAKEAINKKRRKSPAAERKAKAIQARLDELAADMGFPSPNKVQVEYYPDVTGEKAEPRIVAPGLGYLPCSPVKIRPVSEKDNEKLASLKSAQDAATEAHQEAYHRHYRISRFIDHRTARHTFALSLIMVSDPGLQSQLSNLRATVGTPDVAAIDSSLDQAESL